jgi:hypothetical protein
MCIFPNLLHLSELAAYRIIPAAWIVLTISLLLQQVSLPINSAWELAVMLTRAYRHTHPSFDRRTDVFYQLHEKRYSPSCENRNVFYNIIRIIRLF